MLELMGALENGWDYSTIENLRIRKKEKITRNSKRPKLTTMELNDLPFADQALYKKYDQFRDYSFEIFAGCSFTCSFCEIQNINEGESIFNIIFYCCILILGDSIVWLGSDLANIRLKANLAFIASILTDAFLFKSATMKRRDK